MLRIVSPKLLPRQLTPVAPPRQFVWLLMLLVLAPPPHMLHGGFLPDGACMRLIFTPSPILHSPLLTENVPHSNPDATASQPSQLMAWSY
jgi:hypothetical protein